MDVGLSQSLVNTATAMASQKTSDAVNLTVLKKALDIQKSSAAQMLEALPQPQQPGHVRLPGHPRSIPTA